MPPEYLQRLKDDWKGIKQNGTPVIAYSNKILQLTVQLHKSNEDRLDTFLYGLDDYIKFDVRVTRPKEFNAAVATALEHEMKHNKGKPKEASKSSNSQQSSSSQSPQQSQSQQSGKNSGKSTAQTTAPAGTSQSKGKDKAKESPPLTPDEKSAKGILGGYLTPDEVTTYSQEGRCFRCHTKGHMKRDCPKKDPKSHAPKPADSAAGTSSVSPVVAHPNPPRHTPPPDALFKFYGLVRGECVVILLDTCSTYNVISASLVKKTDLRTCAIPPIPVSGFAQGMAARIKEQCPAVPFTIQTTTFHRRFLVSPLVGCDMILGIGWVRDFVPQIDWEVLSLKLPLSDGNSITIYADLDFPASSGVPCIVAIIPIDPSAPHPYVIPQLRTSQALVPQGQSTLSNVDSSGEAVRPRLGTPPRSPSPRASAQDRRLAFPRRRRPFDSRLTCDKVSVSVLPCFRDIRHHRYLVPQYQDSTPDPDPEYQLIHHGSFYRSVSPPTGGGLGGSVAVPHFEKEGMSCAHCLARTWTYCRMHTGLD